MKNSDIYMKMDDVNLWNIYHSIIYLANKVNNWKKKRKKNNIVTKKEIAY